MEVDRRARGRWPVAVGRRSGAAAGMSTKLAAAQDRCLVGVRTVIAAAARAVGADRRGGRRSRRWARWCCRPTADCGAASCGSPSPSARGAPSRVDAGREHVRCASGSLAAGRGRDRVEGAVRRRRRRRGGRSRRCGRSPRGSSAGRGRVSTSVAGTAATSSPRGARHRDDLVLPALTDGGCTRSEWDGGQGAVRLMADSGRAAARVAGRLPRPAMPARPGDGAVIDGRRPAAQVRPTRLGWRESRAGCGSRPGATGPRCSSRPARSRASGR